MFHWMNLSSSSFLVTNNFLGLNTQQTTKKYYPKVDFTQRKQMSKKYLKLIGNWLSQ